VEGPGSQHCKREKSKIKAGHQWLTPIVLAPWEPNIRKITVSAQPGQKTSETPSQWKKAGLGGACLSSQQQWEM
jgi:hypothetical protein